MVEKNEQRVAKPGLHHVQIVHAEWREKENDECGNLEYYFTLKFQNNQCQFIYDNLFFSRNNKEKIMEFLQSTNFLSESNPTLDDFPEVIDIIGRELTVKTTVVKLDNDWELAIISKDGYSLNAIERERLKEAGCV